MNNRVQTLFLLRASVFLAAVSLAFFLFLNVSGGTEFTPTLKYTLAKVVIRVVDAATNRGIAGASVSLGATGYSAAASTNQSGEAHINDIPIPSRASRNLTVSCSAAGYLSSSKTITVRDSASAQYFTVALRKSTHESPPPYTAPAEPLAKVTVSGKVYDRATNEPIAMAGVTIAGAGFSQGDSSDNMGRYSISGCPSDKALGVNCRKAGYRVYNARLPILGNISHYTHDIPLDRLMSPAPEDTGYGVRVIEPPSTKELEYTPGIDPRKFKPREEKEESQFVEKRAPADDEDVLRTPIIADFEGGISAREEDNAVLLFNRRGVLQWKFPEDGQGDYDFNANDISDHGTYIATSGNCVMKFRSDSNRPIWLYPHLSSDSVAISGDGRYVIAGTRSGCVYLFVGDEVEEGSSEEESGRRGQGRNDDEESWPRPKNVYKWQLEEGGHFFKKVDISYNGQYIAAGGSEGIYLLDRDRFISQEEHTGTGGCIWNIPVENQIGAISISDNGEYVAASTEAARNRGVLYVLSKNSTRPLWTYRFESHFIAGSAISGDGRYVALGTSGKVHEFLTTGGGVPIWSCKKTNHNTVVDISFDGKYVYANKGSVRHGNRWYNRTYLWDRDYFMRQPYLERPFAVYDSDQRSTPWVSMSETGDTLVLIDGNRPRVERPTPHILLDLISGRAYCPELEGQNKQRLRVFITNPGQAVPDAILRGVLYLPLAQFAESYYELVTSSREDENEAATIEDVIGEMAANLESSTEVFYGYITLAEHSHIDENLEFKIPKLFDLPIVTWGMTAALLRGRSYTDFDTADLVAWAYTQAMPRIPGITGVEPYRFVWVSEPGTPPVIPPEEPTEEEPPTEEPPPGGGQPQAVNLDLRPVKITFNDGINEYDATGIRNPRLEAGTRYTVKVDVRNEGPEDLRGMSIPIKITTRPATRELSGNITHIPSGETRAIVYPNVTYDAGSYTFFVLVDSDEVITESGQGQNNNLIQGTATFGEGGAGPHAGLPDLEPEALTINGRDTSSRPRLEFPVGDYRFRVVVINSGERDLEERAIVKVKVDKVNEQRNRYEFYKEQTFEIDTVRRGGVYIKEDLENISFEPGKYRFIVNVDPELRVAEISDDNNTFEGGAAFVEGAPPVQPEPELPDLRPVGFFIGDGDAMGLRNPVLAVGEQYRMRISVANIGNADLQGVQVPIDIVTEPPTLPLTATIDSIPVGETRDAVLDVSFGEGSYTFNIAVNQGQVTPESNIDNNTAIGTATFVAVVGPGAGLGAGPGAGPGGVVPGAGPAVGPGGAGPGAGPATAPVPGAAQIRGGFRAWLGRLIPQWGGTAVQPVPARTWLQVIPQEKAGLEEEEEETGVIEKEEGEKPLPPAERPMWPWWILLLVLYVYFSLSLHVIAKKTTTPKGWLAWIPIISFYLMCKIGRRSGWWFWLLLIPLVNIIIGVIVWMGIAKARKKAAWLGILMLVPIINLVIPGYLAFSK